MTRAQMTQGVVDTGLAGTLMTYSLWAAHLRDGLELGVLIGGAVLLTLRILLALLDLVDRRSKKGDDPS